MQMEVPMRLLCLRLAHVGTSTAISRRCDRGGDMISGTCHPLRAFFLGGKLDPTVDELCSFLL